jgi:hypothetical protein
MSHIHAWQVIATIALIAFLVYMRRKSTAQRPAPGPSREDAAIRAAVERTMKPDEAPEVAFANLRRKAFETPAQRLGQAGDVPENQAFGWVMEMGLSSSVVTLVCFADGDASVYYQTGGGMIGGIAHESTRKAAKEFVASAAKVLPALSRVSGLPPLPEQDKVRFSALTPRGVLTTEIGREALGGTQPDALSALYYSGQQVVSEMREVQTAR